jgi:hypothetical protein
MARWVNSLICLSEDQKHSEWRTPLLRELALALQHRLGRLDQVSKHQKTNVCEPRLCWLLLGPELGPPSNYLSSAA